jgi:hypothetical protein
MLDFVKKYMKDFKPFANKRLWIAAGIFALVFIGMRLPYFLYINVPLLVPDSQSYLDIAHQIIQGNVPKFMIRTPGYPLFLAISYLFSKQLITVIYLQTIISLLTGLLFIQSINKTFPKLTFAAVVAMLITMSSTIYLNCEVSIQTENLYTNLLIITLSWIILVLKSQKNRYWALSSLFMMLVIIVRPSGLFLVPIFALLLIYQLINKYPIKAKLSLTLPAISLFVLMCIYNFFTIGHFSISPFGAYGKLGTVVTYMEPDSSFPDYVNKSIEAIQKEIPEEHRQLIKNSSETKDLQVIFIIYFDHLLHFYNETMKQNPEMPKNQVDLFNLHVKNAKMITNKAMEKYPDGYKKFVKSMLYQYFVCLAPERSVTYPYYSSYDKCNTVCLKSNFYSENFKQGQVCGFKINKIRPSQTEMMYQNFDESSLFKFPRLYNSLASSIFQNIFWVFLSFGIFLFSGIKFIISKLKNTDSLIVLIVVSMNLGAAILTCLVQMGMIRYASTLHFTYYVAPALLPILLTGLFTKKPKRTTQKIQNSKNENQIAAKQTKTKGKKNSTK